FMGLDAIIGMGTAINPNVKDLLSFVLWFIAPFNLIKGILLSIITIPLYKKIEKLIKNNLA
ncbi:MAG: ECF transporter S component, partial [Peptostreptococcus sp.]|nr:ECF transporter S component [Peptostreptococcus sp.]